MKAVDITGDRYGRLIAIRKEPTISGVRTRWVFQCDCGKVCTIRLNDVRTGKIQSCGCLQLEKAAANLPMARAAWTTHGMTGSKLYNVWCGMKGRCYTKTNTCYPHYGARGIRVCDEWLNSPKAFIDWAIGNGYSDGLSIDRIDGTKGYSPDNCRWATPKDQVRNISSNVKITAFGETKILADWSVRTGIPRDTIQQRINRGFSPEEAMT